MLVTLTRTLPLTLTLTSSSHRLSSVSLSNIISGVTKSGRTFFQKSGSLTSISACSREDSPVNILFLKRKRNERNKSKKIKMKMKRKKKEKEKMKMMMMKKKSNEKEKYSIKNKI